jgi:hypothetical protein
MCRGDSGLGPLLWTVWTGDEDVTLVAPPAPPFVLAKQGPIPFAASFGKPLEQVFPLRLDVVTPFESDPKRRSVIVGESGVIDSG